VQKDVSIIKQQAKPSVARKGILGILVFAMLIPFFVLSIVTTLLSISANKTLLAENLNNACAIQVNSVESFFGSYADSLQMLGLMGPIQSLIHDAHASPFNDKALVLTMLNSQKLVKPSTQAIFIVNNEGRILLSTDDTMASSALSAVELPDKSLSPAYTLRYVTGSTPGESKILLFSPLLYQDNQSQYGYMVCIMGIDYLQKLLDSAVLPDFGAMYLRDQAGHTVCSLYKQSDGVSVDKAAFDAALDAAWATRSGTPFSSPVTAFTENALSSTLIDYASQAPSNISSFSFTTGKGLQQEEFLAYHSAVGPTGWSFVISARTSILLNVICQLGVLMLLVGLLGFLTWIILTTYATRRISAPMKKIVDQLSIEVQRNYILNALSGILIGEYDCETDTLHISPEYADANKIASKVDQWRARLLRTLPPGNAPLPLLDISIFSQPVDVGFVDCPMLFPDGHTERYRLTFAKIRNEHNKVVRILCRANSIEQDYHKWEKLHEEATIDGLTGIYNRMAGERTVNARLLSMPETCTSAFLLIDLDHFKPINDTYGHQTGDQVLRTAAQWLHTFFRGNDIVFRLGGDEFVVLVENIDISSLTSRMDSMKQHQFSNQDSSVPPVSFSMGVVFFDKYHADYETLYRTADRALYRAKKEHVAQIIQLTDAQSASE
jgi:diguanylate cyclase (GGDEF)-like protein